MLDLLRTDAQSRLLDRSNKSAMVNRRNPDWIEITTHITEKRKARSLARDTGISPTVISNLRKGVRHQPEYRNGVKILDWYEDWIKGGCK